MTSRIKHPAWCLERRCSVDRRNPFGEHRSTPAVLARAGERVHLVVTLARRTDRPDAVVELRLSVRLLSRTDSGQAAEAAALVRRLGRILRKELTR